MVDRRPMIIVIHFDAVNERQIVDAIGEVRHQFRNPAARFTVLSELERGRDDAIGRSRKSRDLADRSGRFRDLPAGEPIQRRLVFEQVHLAHAAFHEQEDAALGLCRRMLRLGQHGFGDSLAIR